MLDGQGNGTRKRAEGVKLVVGVHLRGYGKASPVQ